MKSLDYKTVDLQKQESTKIQLIIYGKTVVDKNPEVYALIKDKIDFDKYQNVQLIALVFRQISTTEISSMDFKYGLWEKRGNQRVEKEFKVAIEK